MGMEILEKLFGSSAKVKILKLFLYNKETPYDTSDIIERAKVSKNSARSECSLLERIKFIKSRSYFKNIKRKVNGKKVVVKKRTNGWMLNADFPYIEPLEVFFSAVNPFKNGAIISKIGRTGKIKLMLISGIFIKEPNSRVDLMVVGDGLKRSQLENIIKTIESEMGREIRYALFETKDFQYRYYMFDKLIRDVLDYPHQKIINKLDL